MKQKITEIKQTFSSDLKICETIEDIEPVRIKYLGKKGAVTEQLKQLSSLSIDEKKLFGPQLHELKEYISNEIDKKINFFEEKLLLQQLASEKIDFTLPGNSVTKGKTHILSQVTDEINKIFNDLGFVVAEGPEIETDYYNFSALNFPADHPSRDMHDTFYVDHPENLLLRTHTSGVQIHVMENFKPPVRVIMPGKVFRSDADMSHSPVFHQVEGLYVDKNVSFSHLKGTLQYFMDRFFKGSKNIRLRPSFFPFTEPSVEMDVQCVFCGGKGCGMCKQTGWIEILGAGMVDPNVLKNVKVNADEYSGFAFGVGVERLAILKYGITNIKLFYENHYYFLEQF
ncbi:MAG: phenylalanine--tRNA ligase subunit alpha [Candidatus Margulisbacteria bacterium]|nr:phenylalanine--tRNA ligase subunit alpha [Candidatus Margulisiibacteriota bacterium]